MSRLVQCGCYGEATCEECNGKGIIQFKKKRPDTWEDVGVARAAKNAAQHTGIAHDDPSEGASVEKWVGQSRYGDVYLYTNGEFRIQYGVFSGTEMRPCCYCNRIYVEKAYRRCDACHEVESHLSDFIATERGREFVEAALQSNNSPTTHTPSNSPAKSTPNRD